MACGDFVAGAAGLEACGNGRGDLRRRIDNDDTGCFERPTLGGIAAGVAGDDGAGMTHFLARRRGGPCNEGDHRLAHGFRIISSAFLHRAADLADDDGGVRARIFVERFERIARGGTEHRIAANADESRLAEAGARQVEAD